MKKLIFLILSVLTLTGYLNSQAIADNKYNLSASWTPKLYFNRISYNLRLLDYSLSGISIFGEFSLKPRLNVYSGFQFDDKYNSEFIDILDSPNNGDDYSLLIDRLTSIPLGIKYFLTRQDRNTILYSKVGFNYTRVRYEKKDCPYYEGVSGKGEGVNNILLGNICVGSLLKINKSVYPFIETGFGHSIIGDNAGVSILEMNFGINVSF